MTDISVVAWNLHQAMDRKPENMAATWRYLSDEIKPTVALIQESARTPDAPGGVMASRTPYGYETSVMAFGGRLEALPDVVTRYSRKHSFAIAPSVPGSFAAARIVDIPHVEPIVAISQYGVMDPFYDAQVGVIRAVADLIPLFDTTAYYRRIVLGGDLNAYDQTSDRVRRERWAAIFAPVESLGLVNLLKLTQPERGPLEGCPCRRPDCWHVETFRHRSRGLDSPSPYTTDYLFASRDLADRLVRLEIRNDRREVWVLSDHCPLIATFDL